MATHPFYHRRTCPLQERCSVTFNKISRSKREPGTSILYLMSSSASLKCSWGDGGPLQHLGMFDDLPPGVSDTRPDFLPIH